MFAQECHALPGFAEQQWETDSEANGSATEDADAFELRVEEAEEETEDAADVAEEEIEPVSVADRIQNLESSISYSATAAGSVEAASHHADEEGLSEIRAYDVDSHFLDLNDI